MKYARKIVKSGLMKEIYYYPVQPCGYALPCGKKQREAQAAYNRKKSGRMLVQYVNTNFFEGDIWMHPTFFPEEAPQSYEEASKIIKNYLRRVSRWRSAHGLPPMKYIYVIEEQIYKTGKNKGRSNWHYHLWMSEMPRDVAEDLWTGGERVNAMRFQPERFGQEAAARYVTKAPKGTRRFVCSRNCEKPKVEVQKEIEISSRKMQSMAEVHCDDAAYWQRKYPGYYFCGMERFWNEYNSRWYLRVAMRKIPEWKTKKKLKVLSAKC